MATEKMRAALQHELAAYADRGAGLAELLDHLHRSNHRFARRNRLSEEQLDELSLYCWTLQKLELRQPERYEPEQDPARVLWGGFRTATLPARARSRRLGRAA
jgi:hypothetical protein